MAASSYSEGTWSTKPFIIQIVKGTLKAVYMRMRPSWESMSPSVRYMRKIGITTTTGGMNRVDRMKKSWSFFARSVNREYAQAAGTPRTVARIVDAPATTTELRSATDRSDAPPDGPTNTSR